MKNCTWTSRHFLLSLLPVLLALSGSLLAQPTINSLSFSPQTVNTSGGPVAVTVSFNMTGQGAYYFATAFADPSGNSIGYQIDKSVAPANSVTDSVVITLPKFSPPGTWRIAYVFALDANGFVYLNSPDAVTAAFPALGSLTVGSTVDTTPPTLTSFTLSPATIDTTAASTTLTVGFNLTDDISGATFFQIVLTSPSGNATQMASKTFTPATSVSDSLTVTFPRFSEAGTWTVSSIFVGDAANNTAVLATGDLTGKGPTTLTVTSTTDSTAPTLTAFSYTPTTINVTGAPAIVTFTFQETDDLSGATDFQATFISPSGILVTGSSKFAASTSASGTAVATFPKGSEDGTWTIASVFVGDSAGNTHIYSASDLVGLGFTPTQLTVVNATGDTTPPVVTPTISPAPNATGWNTSVPVTISWTFTDPESGITTSSGCTNGSVSGETSGISFTCSATNGSGLITTVTATIRVDLTPPIVTASISPVPNAAGWTNTATTVSWNLSDPTSGIDLSSGSGCGTVVVSPETAGTVLTCIAVNNAGLSRAVSVTVKIDATPPAAFASATPAPNAAGWNNTNVTVTFAGTDALSGIASCSAPAILSTEGTGLTASGICVDNAGNTSAPAVVSGIKIDKTAPVASNVHVTPATIYINNTVSVTATVTDSGGSNLASAAYNIDGGSFIAMSGTFGGSSASVSATTATFTATGAHNICVRATDVAGNVGATTCTTLSVFTAAAPTSGTTCNGAYNGTFNGSIFVSTGQVCDFEGTVNGSIIQTGGTLILLNATVAGAVQVTGGVKFSINATTINSSLQVLSLPTSTTVSQACSSHIKGSVQVQSNGSPVDIGATSGCAGNQIDGSLQVQSNSAQTQLVANHVNGSLQDNSNNAASPASQVISNIIVGALQCSGNSSITGSGNTASVKQGQCSTF
jgi:hypothetical protein